MNLNFKTSLGTRVTGLFAICFLSGIAVTIAISVLTSRTAQQQQTAQVEQFLQKEQESQRQLLNEGLKQKASSMAELLAMIATQPILDFDYDTLGSYTRSAVKDPDIGHVRVLDPAGKVLAGTEVIPNLPTVTHDVVEDGSVIAKVEIGILPKRTESAIASMQDRLGAFQARMEAGVEAARHRLMVQSLGWGMLVLMIGIVITRLIVRSITGPLAKVTEVAQHIARGDLSQRADIERSDEIGILAAAFHEMGDALQRKAEAAQEIATGNLSVSVEVASDEDALGHAMVEMVASLRGVQNEIQRLVESAVAGQLDVRGDTAHSRGEYARIIEGINRTLDAVLAPIDEAVQVLERVAAQDLSPRMMGDYQGDHARIKAAVNSAVENCVGLIRPIRIASDQLRESSAEISAGNRDLASRTEEQAASLQETAAAMEEMAATTKAVAERARQCHEATTATRKTAREGGSVVNQAVEAMVAISQASDRIKDIIQVIDEIAFQTNLLSLNAAVEAARAGEHGRGFAVVAAEVRNLARRSAKAAQEIKELIEDSVHKVEDGTRLVNASGETLGEIVESVCEVNTIVDDIANTSAEQTKGIDAVNDAIGQMNTVIQQNAALVEEIAASTEALSEQSTEMQRQVAVFRLEEGGEEKVPPAATPVEPTPHTVATASPSTTQNATEIDSEWEDF